MNLRKLKRVKAKRRKGDPVKGPPDIACKPFEATGLPHKRHGKPSAMEVDGKVSADKIEGNIEQGNILRGQGRFIEAIACYQRVIELDPDNCSAKHMLAAISGQTTETAPQEHIKKLFDHYSASFDQHLVRQLAYEVPANLYKCLQSIIAGKTHFSNVIDLGSGTGLSGRTFRNITDRLTGIDLSPEMVRVAEGKKIYDSMQIGDVVEYLEATEEKFDLFIATDVFVYIGSLEAMFNAVKACSLPEAYFIFSTESTESDDFVLLKSGRYAHSRTYIQALTQKHGFEIELCQATSIRKAKEQLIAGDPFFVRHEKNYFPPQ
jgi:predicted TPR repeat methyltransferase